MKFRIKYVDGLGYFAQTRVWFLWHTIGNHVDGFGLYGEQHLAHPMPSESLAAKRCSDYAEWRGLLKRKPTYKRVIVAIKAASK